MQQEDTGVCIRNALLHLSNGRIQFGGLRHLVLNPPRRAYSFLVARLQLPHGKRATEQCTAMPNKHSEHHLKYRTKYGLRRHQTHTCVNYSLHAIRSCKASAVIFRISLQSATSGRGRPWLLKTKRAKYLDCGRAVGLCARRSAAVHDDNFNPGLTRQEQEYL